MSSTIKVNNIQNLAGDDSGIDLSTNDQIILKTANTTAITVDSSQNTKIASNLDVGTILSLNATNTDQAISAGTTTKVEWETVQVDTLSGWDSTNNRYTPTVAGFYLVGGVIRVQMVIVETIVMRIKKNGATDSEDIENSLVHQFNGPNSDIFDNGSYPIPTGLMQMNGSSDYLEVFFSSEEACTIHDSPTFKSHFFAQLVHAT